MAEFQKLALVHTMPPNPTKFINYIQSKCQIDACIYLDSPNKDCDFY